LTIEVTRLFGVSVDAIRKYKNLGLIEPRMKMGMNDIWDKDHIIRMRHIIKSGKIEGKTLQEISRDIELTKEEYKLSEDSDVKKNLIIEDDKGLGYIYKEFLTICFPDRNLRIYHVEDGLTGTEYAIRIKPHLIMLDLALPEKSGMSVHQTLKENPSTRNTKFIIISGNIKDYKIALLRLALKLLRITKIFRAICYTSTTATKILPIRYQFFPFLKIIF
jgi:CheY-like chemotaxis protein